MAQNRQLTRVALDHLAGKAQAANEAREQAAQLLAFADQQDADIKAAMGEAEEATIFGVPYFTYTKKAAWRFREFENDHPHIARQYKIDVLKQELDKDRLLAEQGDILADYQTREFRRVSRQPGAR